VRASISRLGHRCFDTTRAMRGSTGREEVRLTHTLLHALDARFIRGVKRASVSGAEVRGN
jgi:hypothetical protein